MSNVVFMILQVNSHASAPVAALCPVLKIVNDAFKIKYVGYTLIRPIRGGEKRDQIKCANLGPTSHTRSVKWDFAENLVPTPCPKLDEEAKRVLPFLHQRLHGMAVYVVSPLISQSRHQVKYKHSIALSQRKDSESFFRDLKACAVYEFIAHMKSPLPFTLPPFRLLFQASNLLNGGLGL